MHDRPNVGGGANRISLNDARRNYKTMGVCEEKYARYVRPPLPEELPENNRAAALTG
jgi:hypothetical protein